MFSRGYLLLTTCHKRVYDQIAFMDWDLTSYFTEFDGPDYKAHKSNLITKIDLLADQADTLLSALWTGSDSWSDFLSEYEQVRIMHSHLGSYLGCLTAADSSNEAYLKEEAAFSDIGARLSKLTDKVVRGLGQLSEGQFTALCDNEQLEDAQFMLNEYRREALRRMPAELEALAADLGVNGLSAWSRLYFTTMGNLSFEYTDPETGDQTVPMAQLNSLLSNSNRDRRIAAADGAARTFEEHQQTYASALNSISGTRLTLNKRRGVESFLEPSIFQSRITQKTLDALMEAIEQRIEFGRQVFAFRNSQLGIDDPGYVDLRAPLPIGTGGPSWEAGVSMISGAFNRIYPALGEFFDELINKQWVDHTPRNNKRPGGFCTGSLLTRESRIFMTYKDTLNDVMTLAHEAGHAWHSRLLRDARMLASRYPMTIAESASTFAERILTEGILDDASCDEETKLILLDAEVEHMLAFLLDLPVRFRFEKAVYEQRSASTLSPRELCELMKTTQREVFGDTLTDGREDPWFWASKLHFYIDGVQFYNYPYTFGYLLSTAYFADLRNGKEGAIDTYETFLKYSGMLSCEEVVMKTLGKDIQDPAFWSGLIDELARPFELYKDKLKAHVS